MQVCLPTHTSHALRCFSCLSYQVAVCSGLHARSTGAYPQRRVVIPPRIACASQWVLKNCWRNEHACCHEQDAQNENFAVMPFYLRTKMPVA
eukprot:107785-Rhodomonas_salina.1